MKKAKPTYLNRFSPQNSKERKIVHLLKGCSLLFGLLGMLSCIEFFNKSIGWTGTIIFIPSLIIGIGLGIITIKKIIKILPYSTQSINSKGSKIVGGILCGTAFIVPAFSNYYNRSNVVSTEKTCANYMISEKTCTKRKGHYYYFVIKYRNSIESLSISEDLYKSKKIGDYINLCTAKGRLGLEYIVKIE